MSEKSERLFSCMSHIQDEKLDEAQDWIHKKKKPWLAWGAMAAAFTLVIGVVTGNIPLLGGNSSGGAGSSGDGATTFMSYAGPVMPLTLKEENQAITAQRDITLDFLPWVPVWLSNEEQLQRASEHPDATQESLSQYESDLQALYPEGGYHKTSTDITVKDSYVLTNSSDKQETVEVLYPFTASLSQAQADTSRLSIDGAEVETEVIIGSYAGGFQNAIGSEGEGSANLSEMDSWEAYQLLLENGTYLNAALGNVPGFTEIPVTVYELTAVYGPSSSEGVPNPSLRVSFDLDFEKTTVLSYGFHAASYDREAGTMAQGFSIREDWEPNYGQSYYLIVLGDDVQNMNIQGYVTGGTDTEEKLDKTGATVRKYDSDLGTAVELALQQYLQSYDQGDSADVITEKYEQYYAAVRDMLIQYGVLSEHPVERYDTGWLEDIFGEVDSVKRVCYLSTQVTVDAGQSLTLAVQMTKEASFDYFCAKKANRDVYGYDMVTQMGTNLTITGQTATLEDRGQIKLIQQNFGFDLKTGQKKVELDATTEHYYLEVKRLKEA